MSKKASKEPGRERILRDAVNAIQKQFGSESIMALGERRLRQVPVISTGSIGLDLALGIGGLPRGRVCEIYGPESSGKTTLALMAIAEAQKAGGICAFIDAEHALDVSYAANLGVGLEELLVSQPDCGEQALEIVDALARCGAVDLIAVDSVAALTPRAEIEGEMGDHHVGLQARLMSQAMRKLTSVAARYHASVLFINQTRIKIGVSFGSPETTTGGMALRFYSSVRMEIRRIGQIKDGDLARGNRTRVKVVKNKLAPPFRKTEFDILFGKGVRRSGELVDLAVDFGIVQKTGAWFSMGEVRLGQGRERTCANLEADKELCGRLADAVLNEAVARGLRPPEDRSADRKAA